MTIPRIPNLLFLATALLATSCVTNDRNAADEDPRLERDRKRAAATAAKAEAKAEAKTATAAKAEAKAKAEAEAKAVPESEFSWWDEQGRVEVDNPDTRKGQRELRRRMRELEIARSQNSGPTPLRVTLDLSDQAAYFYRGQIWVGRSRIATGRRGHATPTGEFSIIEKSRTKRSNLYGRILNAEGEVIDYSADALVDEIPEGGSFLGASMPNWMRLTTDGVGMHTGPIPRPGHAASHGCVRMPSKTARHLYENTRIGTPVTIRP